MTAAPRNTPCSAERTATRRSGLAVILAAVLGLAACGEAVDEQSTLLAPYNGMAVIPPSADADPDQLLGLSGDDIAAKLGKPALIRRDGDAEVWQYRRVHCVLDLFFYGSRKEVEHVDLRDRGDSTDEAVQACFQRMLESIPEST
jgi:hypothetical protein